jgi:hypothetical protein
VCLFGCAIWYRILSCYVKIIASHFAVVQRLLTVFYNRLRHCLLLKNNLKLQTKDKF